MKIVTAIVLLTLGVSTQGNKTQYGIREFENLPTLYLEPLGQLRLYTEQWRVVSYLPLEDLIQQETHIEEGIKTIRRLDHEGQHNRTTYQLERCLLQAKKDRERLFSSVGYELPWSKRIRRGVFNFIGDISKILFGTMSDEDAEYYNREIDLVHKDNKRNAELFRNQTQILKVVLERNDKLIEDYRGKIDVMNQNINDIRNIEKIQLLEETILELSLMLELEILSYQRNVDVTNQAILDGRKGNISPNIIEPQAFFKIIQKIRAEEGTNRLPLVTIAEHYYKYLQICSIEIGIINKRLVSVVKIPILETNSYMQYKVHSIPSVQTDGTIIRLEAPQDYIITNMERTQMSPSSFFFLNSCKKLNNVYYCKRLEPKYRITKEKNCLSRWLREILDNSTKICTPFVGTMQYSLYLPLHTGTDWIIIPHRSEQVQILCGQISNFITLTRPSIIHLEPNCIASTDFVVLEPIHMSNGIVTEFRFDLPNYNFTFIHETFQQLQHNINLKELNIPKIDKLESQTLGRRLDELVKEAETIGNHKRTENYIETATRFGTYLAYGLLAILTLYVSYKLRVIHFIKWCISMLAKPCIHNTYNNHMHGNRGQIINTTTETTTRHENVPMVRVNATSEIDLTDIRRMLTNSNRTRNRPTNMRRNEDIA
ncbi:uncharacterized protein LOC117610939 [Osmia lignaria lignaria]|uniref:uncharacterized protein LOC117610939 n=1 Tax=Osmia lignaria lignaria TaxID=1437193 RepID=UPI00402BCBAA